MTITDRTFAAARSYARAKPVKGARQLRQVEGSLALKVHHEDETARLEAMAAGLRAGLGDKVCCQDCGHVLEDADSRSRKVGPDCWAKRQRKAPA